MKIFFSAVSSSLSGIIKALLFLVVAFITAWIIKMIVTSLLKRVLPKKLNENNPEFYNSIIAFTSRISYFLVFMLFIPGIFAFMGMEAAVEPVISMMETMVGFVPNLIVAFVIIFIGTELSRLCGTIVAGLIKSAKLEESVSKMIPARKKEVPIAKICSAVTEFLVLVIFIIQAMDVLNLKILDGIGGAVIGYLPHILGAVLILFGCFALDSVIDKALSKKGYLGLSMLAKVIIYVVGVFMILSQLRIAETIVNSVFIIIIAAIATAFAIAFGIGGRDFAHRVLGHFESSLKSQKLLDEHKQ